MPLLQGTSGAGNASWTNNITTAINTDQGSGAGKLTIGGRQSASLADSGLLTSLGAPTPFDVTATLGAGQLLAGSCLKIRAVVRSAGVNGADTLQYTLRWNDGAGADVLVASTALNVGANNRVVLSGHAICRAPGAAAEMSSFWESADTSVGARTSGPAAGAVFTLNTTAAITIDVLCTHSANNAGNQSVLESLYVEIV